MDLKQELAKVVGTLFVSNLELQAMLASANQKLSELQKPEPQTSGEAEPTAPTTGGAS